MSVKSLSRNGIEGYCEAYLVSRYNGDIPALHSEHLTELVANVKDALVTEACRTLYYKPEQPKIVEQ